MIMFVVLVFLLELDTLTLTNVSAIPEDSVEAETYYSQFEDEFEDEEEEEGDNDDLGGSDCSDSDYEYDALVDQMEAALELGTQETALEDELVGEKFSPSLRQQRIKALRQYPF